MDRWRWRFPAVPVPWIPTLTKCILVIQGPDTIRIYAPTIQPAIMLVILTNVAVACGALVTWVCYCMGKAIRDEPIARWKVWLAHL